MYKEKSESTDVNKVENDKKKLQVTKLKKVLP